MEFLIEGLKKLGIGSPSYIKQSRAAQKPMGYEDLIDVHQDLANTKTRLHQAEADLRYVQEREKYLNSPVRSETHDSISTKFFRVFNSCRKQVRSVSYVEMIPEVRPKNISQYITRVVLDDINLQQMKLPLIVEGIVADILAQDILMSPFSGCHEQFAEEFGSFYTLMLAAAESEEEIGRRSKLLGDAHKWRALTLCAYEKAGSWPPHASATAKLSTIEFHRKTYYANISEKIRSVVRYFGRLEGHDSDNGGVDLDQWDMIVQDAGALAVQLGMLPARLVCIDKSFVQANRRIHTQDEMIVHLRWDTDEDQQRDISSIINPGFLKYGNDAGEYPASYAVWISAKVQSQAIPGLPSIPHTTARNTTSPDRLPGVGNSLERLTHEPPPRRFDEAPRRFDKAPRRFDEAPRRSDEAPRRFDEAPPRRSYEAPSRRSDETPPRRSYEAPPRRSDETPPRRSYEAPPRWSYEAPPRRSYEAPSRRSYEAPSRRSYEAPSPRSYEAPSRRSYEAPSRRSDEAPSPRYNEAPSRRSYEATPSRFDEEAGQIEDGNRTTPGSIGASLDPSADTQTPFTSSPPTPGSSINSVNTPDGGASTDSAVEGEEEGLVDAKAISRDSTDQDGGGTGLQELPENTGITSHSPSPAPTENDFDRDETELTAEVVSVTPTIDFHPFS